MGQAGLPGRIEQTAAASASENLHKPERDPSGHRRYDEETVRFLRAIKEAQAVGFTLAEIAEYLRAGRRSGTPSEALRVRMAAKIDEIDARIRFYPSATGGFFVTGGVGYGEVRASAPGFGSATESGGAAILGMGYDIRVARNTSITPYWNGYAMRNSNTNANVGQVGLAITLH